MTDSNGQRMIITIDHIAYFVHNSKTKHDKRYKEYLLEIQETTSENIKKLWFYCKVHRKTTLFLEQPLTIADLYPTVRP